MYFLSSRTKISLFTFQKILEIAKTYCRGLFELPFSETKKQIQSQLFDLWVTKRYVTIFSSAYFVKTNHFEL